MLMVLSTVFVATGQLFWKFSGGEISIDLIIGFILYGVGAFAMIIAFRFGELSVLHPMLSLSYVIALFLGVVFLNELIDFWKILGVASIILGVIIMGFGNDH